jgi:hypothetical protein
MLSYEDEHLELVATAYERFGPSLDRLLVIQDEDRLHAYERETELALYDLGLSEFARLATTFGHSNRSSMLLLLYPDEDRYPIYGIITNYIADKIFERQCRFHGDEVVEEFRRFSHPRPWMAVNDLLLETVGHRIVPECQHFDLKTIQSGINNTLLRITFCERFSFKGLSDLRRTNDSTLDPGYYQSAVRNQSAFAGFAVADDKHVIPFRYTVGARNNISIGGLDDLYEALPSPHRPCERSRKPWYFVFVVPSRLKGDTQVRPLLPKEPAAELAEEGDEQSNKRRRMMEQKPEVFGEMATPTRWTNIDDYLCQYVLWLNLDKFNPYVFLLRVIY